MGADAFLPKVIPVNVGEAPKTTTRDKALLAELSQKVRNLEHTNKGLEHEKITVNAALKRLQNKLGRIRDYEKLNENYQKLEQTITHQTDTMVQHGEDKMDWITKYHDLASDVPPGFYTLMLKNALVSTGNAQEYVK